MQSKFNFNFKFIIVWSKTSINKIQKCNKIKRLELVLAGKIKIVINISRQ